MYLNCTEKSHSEVYVSFFSSFLYLRPYALTRDDAEAYDVSLFYFLMFIIIFSYLVWLSVDKEKTDFRIRRWLAIFVNLSELCPSIQNRFIK